MELNDFPLVGSNEPTRFDLSDSNFQDAINILIAHEYALCRGDDDTADELLANLEPHLRQLNWAQNEWLRGLSGDLHMLNNEEVFVNNPYSSNEYRRLISEAWINVENDPDSFLSLLRFKQNRFAPASLAYARGRTYSILGFPNVATAFLQLAARLDPQQSFYKMALITLLNRQKRSDELDRELKEILADPMTSPDLVVFAVTISFSRAVKRSEDVARIFLGEIRQELQDVFNQHSLETLNPKTAVMGLHTLGSIQDKLNRPAKAQKLYRQALEIDSKDQAVRVSLALSLLPTDEIEAYQIFSQVATEGTPFEIAYLFAAKHAGEQGLFEESTRMAEKALASTEDMTVRAYAYEFLAISEAEVNGPTDAAQYYFSEALRLAPDNATIQRNYDNFLEELNSSKAQAALGSHSAKIRSSSTWLLDAGFLSGLVSSVEISEGNISRNLSVESERLNGVTTESLGRQSNFAHAS